MLETKKQAKQKNKLTSYLGYGIFDRQDAN